MIGMSARLLLEILDKLPDRFPVQLEAIVLLLTASLHDTLTSTGASFSLCGHLRGRTSPHSMFRASLCGVVSGSRNKGGSPTRMSRCVSFFDEGFRSDPTQKDYCAIRSEAT